MDHILSLVTHDDLRNFVSGVFFLTGMHILFGPLRNLWRGPKTSTRIIHKQPEKQTLATEPAPEVQP